VGVQPYASAASTPVKDPEPVVQKAGWAPGPVWTGGKSRPHRDSIPDRPARSQSLYRLSYRAHVCVYYISAFYRMSYKLLCGDREGLNCVLSAFSLVCNILQISSYTSSYFCQVLYHWCIYECVCVCVWLHYYICQVLYYWCVFGNTNSYVCQVLYHWCV